MDVTLGGKIGELFKGLCKTGKDIVNVSGNAAEIIKKSPTFNTTRETTEEFFKFFKEGSYAGHVHIGKNGLPTLMPDPNGYGRLSGNVHDGVGIIATSGAARQAVSLAKGANKFVKDLFETRPSEPVKMNK